MSYATPTPSRAPKKGLSPLAIAAIVVACLALVCVSVAIIGAIGSAVDDKPKPTETLDLGAPASTPAPASTAAPATTKAAGPATQIEDGTWLVGEDVAPGTYRLAAPVSSGMCYWGIYKAGTNQADIVDNGVETGGRPTVTLKAGQEFKSSGCGTWMKTG
jgi:hypothetical protein